MKMKRMMPASIRKMRTHGFMLVPPVPAARITGLVTR